MERLQWAEWTERTNENKPKELMVSFDEEGEKTMDALSASRSVEMPSVKEDHEAGVSSSPLNLRRLHTSMAPREWEVSCVAKLSISFKWRGGIATRERNIDDVLGPLYDFNNLPLSKAYSINRNKAEEIKEQIRTSRKTLVKQNPVAYNEDLAAQQDDHQRY